MWQWGASSNVKGVKHNEKKKGKMKQGEVDGDDFDTYNISEKENREILANSSLVELVKKEDLFLNKQFFMCNEALLSLHSYQIQ